MVVLMCTKQLEQLVEEFLEGNVVFHDAFELFIEVLQAVVCHVIKRLHEPWPGVPLMPDWPPVFVKLCFYAEVHFLVEFFFVFFKFVIRFRHHHFFKQFKCCFTLLCCDSQFPCTDLSFQRFEVYNIHKPGL